MSGINVGRWVAGGVAAGVVIWLIEGGASFLYMEDMESALQAHGLAMEMNLGAWALSVLVSLLVGLTLIFFYAAARPRFGPGPRTAIMVAVALWIGGYVVSILGYQMMDLFPAGMLALWAVVGLVELLVAGLVGGRIYREP
jgi:hypothetical protein